ncbi:MAG: TolB family protein [Candidatus Methylomirabilales bacterium]
MGRRGIVLLTAMIVAGLLALGCAEAGGRREGRITFHEGSGVRYRIAVIAAEEGTKRPLTPGLSRDGNPSFSPRGDRIAFQRDGDIWAMNPDGSNEVNLTKTETYEGCPWFSGDGTRIVFDGLRNEKSDLFVIDADGSNLRRLTRGPGNNA